MLGALHEVSSKFLLKVLICRLLYKCHHTNTTVASLPPAAQPSIVMTADSVEASPSKGRGRLSGVFQGFPCYVPASGSIHNTVRSQLNHLRLQLQAQAPVQLCMSARCQKACEFRLHGPGTACAPQMWISFTQCLQYTILQSDFSPKRKLTDGLFQMINSTLQQQESPWGKIVCHLQTVLSDFFCYFSLSRKKTE